jgi:hypothetical protein
MPIPTPGAATYHANIDLPAGADAPTRASIATPLEQLTDRTAKVASFFDFGAGEFVYPSTKNRAKFFGVAGASLGFKESDGSPEWKMLDLGTGVAALYAVPVAGSARARMWIPLNLPEGAVITGFTVFVEKGADNASASDQWGARLGGIGGFLTFPAGAAIGLSGLGSMQRAGSGTGRAVMGESGLTHTVQGNATYSIYIEGPSAENATGDRVWGASVAFTDPGPRP